MSSSGSLVGSSCHLDMGEIFQLLESSSLSVINETVELVRDNLGSTPESWLLNSLVDFYIQSGNIHARDLLCMVRQNQQKVLMSKIDEHLQKVSTRLKALNLLNHIIRNEPTWTHHILTSKTFQSVLKCLQIDTDLPTITSALYIVATIMPKVASQVSTHLPAICSIYIRLVSWHTIKPVGAVEANLIHVHSAVYALFLCLYGMFPCYFMKYLQHYFQPGSSVKGSNFTDKEKLRIFENSVSPMLDQVRFHPGLVVKTSNFEMSTERWRKIESQDIIADISKLVLDVTENSSAGAERKMSVVSDANEVSVQTLSTYTSPKTSRTGSNAENLLGAVDQSQEGIWSPLLAIGLSTPPHSRAMSPSLGCLQDSSQTSKLDASQRSDLGKEADDSSTTTKPRPLSLNMSLVDSFVPNRPHQTSSAATTPLKHLVPAFFLSSSQSISNSQASSPHKELRRNKSDQRLTDELAKYQPIKLSSNNNLDSASETIRHQESSFIVKELPDSMSYPGCIPSQDSNAVAVEQPDDFVKITKKDLEGPSDVIEQVVPVQKLLNLTSRNKYIEKTPNELLDLHISLLAETYGKFKDKLPNSSNKDVEWQLGDSSSNQTSAEVMILRSQVLQMHSAMLYERHKREQHALRARKLMRKVYDTAAMQEKIKTLTSQLNMKSNEVEDFKTTLKATQHKLRDQEEFFQNKIQDLKNELQQSKNSKDELILVNKELEREKNSIWDECESLKTNCALIGAKLFELEQKFKSDQSNKDLVVRMEAKIRELQLRLFEFRESNSRLQGQVREAGSECKARCLETQITIETYKREIESLRAKYLQTQKNLSLTQVSLEQSELNLQKEKEFVMKGKNYLDEVKSLARSQIKSVEAKYNAQKHICQRLEIEVMELFSRLSAIEGELGDGERTRLSSGPRSIKAISAVQSDANYQYMYSSSPQLSPPTHGSLLAGVTSKLPEARSKLSKQDSAS